MTDERPENLDGTDAVAGGRAEAEDAARDELDARIDASVRSRFAPPSAMPGGLAQQIDSVRSGVTRPVSAGASSEPETATAAAASSRPRATGSVGSPVDGGPFGWRGLIRRAPRRALAAGLLLLLVGGWLLLAPRGASEGDDPYRIRPYQSLPALYADRRADGFEPDWICDDDAEFQRIVERAHGQALSMDEAVPGVRMLGVAYSNTFSRRTVNILLLVDERPVVVSIDRTDRAAGRPEAIERIPEGYHLHRREIGALSVFEYGPFAAPRALDVVTPVAARPGRGDADAHRAHGMGTPVEADVVRADVAVGARRTGALGASPSAACAAVDRSVSVHAMSVHGITVHAMTEHAVADRGTADRRRHDGRRIAIGAAA